MNKIKLSAAQDLVLQGLLSVLGAALLGGLGATQQYIAAHGYNNVGGILLAFFVAFSGLFGVGLKNYVPAHIQQEVQAGKDGIAQLQAENAVLRAQLDAINAQTVKRPVASVAPQSPTIAPFRPVTLTQPSDSHAG